MSGNSPGDVCLRGIGSKSNPPRRVTANGAACVGPCGLAPKGGAAARCEIDVRRAMPSEALHGVEIGERGRSACGVAER